MKTFGIIVAIILGIGVLTGLGFLLKIVLFPVHVAEKEIQTSYDAVNKVINADNAIYNYEWFKQQKEDIDAAGKQLENAYASYNGFKLSLPVEREKWSFEDKQEDSRLRSVVLGLENYLQTLIANYNARAKMATRSIFEDHVLPDYIDALTFIRK